MFGEYKQINIHNHDGLTIRTIVYRDFNNPNGNYSDQLKVRLAEQSKVAEFENPEEALEYCVFKNKKLKELIQSSQEIHHGN